jgi:hypothetical protein
MSTPALPSRLLTIAEVAEVLRIPKPRVYELVRTGVMGDRGDIELTSALNRLTTEVNLWLGEGWRPLGGPIAAITACCGSGFVLQALTKEDPA